MINFIVVLFFQYLSDCYICYNIKNNQYILAHYIILYIYIKNIHKICFQL